MIRLLAGVGVCVGVAAACVAAPDGPSQVEALVARLGSADYADREAATRALEAAGAPARPALEAAARGPSPEVARRAAGVLAKLTRADDSRALLVPKTVRLDYRNVPLAAAVADLKARTGITIDLDPAGVADPFRPVTCASPDLPAWEAVAAFCRAAGVRETYRPDLPVPKPEPRARRTYYAPPPPPTAGDVPVRLIDGTSDALPGSRGTAVRVQALPRVFPGHGVTLGTGDVTLCFDVTPAAGIHWQDVAGVRITKLIDDAGRVGTGGSDKSADPAPVGDVVLFNGGGVALNGGVVLGGVRGNVAMRFDDFGNPMPPSSLPNPRVVPVPLKVATPSARSLRHLEGVVVCELVVPRQPLLTIDDPARHVGTTVEGVGGVRATVLDFAPGRAGKTTMRVRVEAPSPWLALRRRTPWGPLWPQAPRVDEDYALEAFAAAGNTAAASTVAEVNDDGTVQTRVIHTTYPDTPPPKLVLTGPRPTVVDVPFAMENVPLP